MKEFWCWLVGKVGLIWDISNRYEQRASLLRLLCTCSTEGWKQCHIPSKCLSTQKSAVVPSGLKRIKKEEFQCTSSLNRERKHSSTTTTFVKWYMQQAWGWQLYPSSVLFCFILFYFISFYFIFRGCLCDVTFPVWGQHPTEENPQRKESGCSNKGNSTKQNTPQPHMLHCSYRSGAKLRNSLWCVFFSIEDEGWRQGHRAKDKKTKRQKKKR